MRFPADNSRPLVAAAVLTTSAAVAAGLTLSGPASARPQPAETPQLSAVTHAATAPAGARKKQAVARGTGGAVSSVDANASRIGLKVLQKGGNAVDAAVATASALGVTEPYSAGIGGGGFFVYYNAKTHKVHTIDGRETAPAAMPRDAFIDPKTGKPYNFTPELVTSGVSVGVPGSLATWSSALDRWGTLPLKKALKPSARLARKGFRIDKTFRKQTLENKTRFAAFPETAKLYLPGGDAPKVGTRFRNKDLARTLTKIGKKGTKLFYRGKIAKQIVHNVQHPKKSSSTKLPVPKGFMKRKDLRHYRVIGRKPTHVKYRGLKVWGMPPSSSGGTTVGEALNILENYKLSKKHRARSLHLYLEASARAFADRGAYVGDPKFVNVPTKTLLSQRFANSRACTIDPKKAATKPVAAGALNGGGCKTASTAKRPDTEGLSTTHMSVVDKHGNAVAYTLTIEQTGGSGMVVPNRGFLLNNELTDFSAVWDADDPNRIRKNKRPRSSISPTIITKKGKLKGVVGSPGGSTIITTVLQVLMNKIDFNMGLPHAIAAPRASQRNTADVTAEQPFIDKYKNVLAPYGHTFTPAGDPGTSAAEIGAVAGIWVKSHGRLVAAAEPVRRGGGAADVVCPRGRGCRR